MRHLRASSTARPEPARRSRAGVVAASTAGPAVLRLCATRLELRRHLERFVAVIIDGIIVNVVMTIVGFTRRKQALHDMIAGTLVVNKH